jgi:hypothetical protein
MRRSRNPSERRHPKVTISLGAMIAFVATAAFLSPIADAAVVVHDNRDGTFQWVVSFSLVGGEIIKGNFLDITKPSDQDGNEKPTSFAQWFAPNQTSSEPGFHLISGVSSSFSNTSQTVDFVLIEWNGTTALQKPLREYSLGQSIAATDNWQGVGVYFYYLPFSDDFDSGTSAISRLAYFGVRTKINNKFHYGWVLLENYTTPIMWAYETVPETPIQIPVPAPSVVVVGGVLGLTMSSRRRHSQGVVR